ncbi:hypothetical protein BGZ60DRAFT_523553 [Tricladium varicosporioides]|nr:hypothetical protein BGZ60DRAFT_523553 [Hymenoscyphus varicosporioides]
MEEVHGHTTYKSDAFLHSNGPSSSTLQTELLDLSVLQETCQDLKVFTQSHPDFEKLNGVWQTLHINTPLAITRPTTTKEISSIIKFCSSRKPQIQISVRSGGHDPWNRSNLTDTLVVDVRDINHINLSSDKTSAVIGGGVMGGPLAARLEEHGLVATMGGCHSVGYTGWSTGGGYGSLNGAFGMGCDQILSARMILANGKIVDADEEMLWALRGGGCGWGVVYEMQIRVYRLEKLLAGMIVYPIEEVERILGEYQEVLDQEYPDEYGGEVMFGPFPGVGRVVCFLFMWAGIDIERGMKFADKIRGLGSPLIDTIAETTLTAWSEAGKSFAPYGLKSTMRSHLLPDRITPDLVTTLLPHINNTFLSPTAMTVVLFHPAHGRATKPALSSSFAKRTSHIMVEAIGATFSDDATEVTAVEEWANSVADDLEKAGVIDIGGYIALTEPGEGVAEKCFGTSWQKLKTFKNEIDPEWLFGNGVFGVGKWR